jgi:hypothetical protein
MMAVLMIKNVMVPHMISWDTGWYGNGLVRSITVRLYDVMIRFGLVSDSETLWCD